jgi:hypothetical protein
VSNQVRCLLLTLAFCGIAPATSQAQRQYYDKSYSYNEINNYHYCKYYYKPAPAATTYSYHYVIYYPSRPRYIYYYNPVRRYYWGRVELDDKGESKGYSLLAEKDRKAKLEDIPETAFPKPAEMPAIPDATDKEKIEKPNTKNLPKDKDKE